MADDENAQLRAEYLRVFRQWGTPDDLYRLMTWGNPKQWEQIRLAVGSVDDALAALDALKKARARAQFRDSLKELIGTFMRYCLVIGGLGGFFSLLKVIFPGAFGWWPR